MTAMTFKRHKPIRGTAGTCVSLKVRYRTRKAAERALAVLVARRSARHTERRVYECDRCGHGFHLTSTPEE